MKFIDRVKEKINLQRKAYRDEVLEKENKSQQKTALKLLCGFFAFMLLFTLLSKSADGLTIAEVSTVNIGRGNVVHEVKAEGKVKSDGQQSVRVAADLLIEKISAKQGQNINAGEEIMSFEKKSADALLLKLQNELAELNLKRENTLTPDELSLVTAKNSYDNAQIDYENAKRKAQDSVKRADDSFKKAVTDYNKLYDEYEYGEYIDKRWKLWTEEPVLTDDEVTLLYQNDGDDEKVAAWKNKIRDAIAAMKAARQKCFDALDTSNKAVQEEADNSIERERTINSAKLAYEDAVKKASKSESQSKVDSQAISLDIKKKSDEIKLLQELKNAGWKLKAPVGGVVLKIEGEPGKITQNGEAASLSRNSEGYMFSATVSKEQVKWIKEGDEVYVNVMESGKKTDVKGLIQKIVLGEKEGDYELNISLPDGIYLVGESGQMTFSQSSEEYYSCLPISALRSDSDGNDFVLVVMQKDTVMGKEATAKRVDVKIIDRDTKIMEVSGTLLPEDNVITSANKSVESGDRVRVKL